MCDLIKTFKTPICIAPGGFSDQSQINDSIGAVFLKTITLNKTEGNFGKVFFEKDRIIINKVGLKNPGLYESIKNINRLNLNKTKIIQSIFASNVEELETIICNLGEYCSEKISAIELNMSCPNISSNQINDLYFYSKKAVDLASQYKIPVSVKLPPDVNRIVNYAKQAEHAGIDFLSISNTIPGVSKEENGDLFFGGISGRKLKPISQRCVYEVKKKVPEISVVGIGGIESLTDVEEYVNLGADAVAICSAEIINPGIASRIAREWLQQHFGKDLNKQ